VSARIRNAVTTFHSEVGKSSGNVSERNIVLDDMLADVRFVNFDNRDITSIMENISKYEHPVYI
jgi:hypothetical protein